MSSPRAHGGRRALGVMAAGVLALTTTAALTQTSQAVDRTQQAGAANAAGPLKLQLLALNDFHGNLEPPSGSSGRIGTVNAGGAEYLATHLEQMRARAAANGAHSVTVAAGDLIGASPLLSAAFHDEPTIEAMNEMGLEITSVGNHEFDEGWRELVRMQNGGCLDDGDGKDNQNSCPDHTFAGADFQYLAANVKHEDGSTVFPGTTVKVYDGIKVGFIGMTLEGTPRIVSQAGVQGLTFTDEVRTANQAATALAKQGVKSIVVLLHEGGVAVDPNDYNGCQSLTGPIVDINAGLSAKIDAVVSGHTHQGYNCVLSDPAGNPRTVTSASSFGRLVTEVDLNINRSSGDVLRPQTTSVNRIVTRDVAPAPELTNLIGHYKGLVADIANKIIGSISGTTTINRTTDASGESPLGNLIADAQRADTTLAGDGPVDVAFMNPGGIRADLTADSSGNVTYGAAFTVQPFNNYDVAMDMTGAQILEVLEQQWINQSTPKILQVSGIEYSWSASAPAGSKVVPGSVLIGGQPLDPTATYRVEANSFLADGGDGFGAFKAATNKYIGGLDIDALAGYLTANSPYTPVATDRIDVLP